MNHLKKHFNPSKKSIIFLLILLCAALSGYFLLKTLVVRKKWVSLVNTNKFVIKRANEFSDSRVFIHSSYFADSISPSVKNEIIPVSCYINRFEYNLNIDTNLNIQEFRIAIQYPTSFILKLNDSISFYSPNLLYEKNMFYLVAEHPKQKNKTIEHFYLTKDFFRKGYNKIEIELISTYKLSGNPLTYISLDALKRGFFLYNFKKIKRKESLNDKPLELPEVYINTFGDEIIDEPKKKVSLTFKTKKQAFITNAKIEIRGNSSQRYNQLNKSFSFNTFDKNWKKKSFSLLGLPEDSEWVLYAPYMDKSLVRNALAYSLSAKTGHYAPRFRYCNVYINNRYWGIYMLVEKPRISSSRINEPQDKSFLIEIGLPDDKQYGGYIGNKETGKIYLKIIQPKSNDLNTIEAGQLKSLFDKTNLTFLDKTLNYKKIDSLINIDTFIDYLLINELSNNCDAYTLSFYFSKAPGKPFEPGPIWDFDLAFGNMETNEWGGTKGWCLSDTLKDKEDYIHSIKWVNVMLRDSIYLHKIKERWSNYRRGGLNNQHILTTLDSLVSNLKDSEMFFFNNVPILEEWIWPNIYVGGTYENEIYYLKSWLIKRIFWIDKQLSVNK